MHMPGMVIVVILGYRLSVYIYIYIYIYTVYSEMIMSCWSCWKFNCMDAHHAVAHNSLLIARIIGYCMGI